MFEMLIKYFDILGLYKNIIFQCVFTTISSMIGFLIHLLVTQRVYLEPYHWKQVVEYYWSPEKRCWVEYQFWDELKPQFNIDWDAAPAPDWSRRSLCHGHNDIIDEKITEELSLVQILTIETFLFFGKTARTFTAKTFL